jgi:antitoxin MazE
MTVRIQKWGNSLGVRIPKDIARRSKMRDGAEVEMLSSGDHVILRPVRVPSLKQLLAKAKRQNRPEVVDWGMPLGGEMW